MSLSMNNEERIENLLEDRKAEMLAQPSLKKRYEKLLLEAFPIELRQEDYFYPNTFDGSEEEDYLQFLRVFKGKQWDKVDFNIFYQKYVQFLMFTKEGMHYYLPAFLKNFYDLKFKNLEHFSYFIDDLAKGAFASFSFDLSSSAAKVLRGKSSDYSDFERLTPLQSKSVAIFLVNVANLLPDCYESQQSQLALTSYWGNFLLF